MFARSGVAGVSAIALAGSSRASVRRVYVLVTGDGAAAAGADFACRSRK